MGKSTIHMRLLILAAYLLAMLVPVLAWDEGRQQSQPDHERMMAMAGHSAQMPGMDSADGGSQMLLCQQHCLYAVAALPPLHRAVGTVARGTETAVTIPLPAALLAIPPPGPPPKVAVI